MVFYLAYREWFAWLVLVGVLCLPLLSLAVSLPAMVSTRLVARCPGMVPMEEEAAAVLTGDCRLPMPPVRGRFRVTRVITGESWMRKDGAELPTEHCGQLTVTPVRVWVCDYLGLICLPVRKKEAGQVLVLPESEPVDEMPDLSRYLANAWRPKPGGGFAENHELRLYRPGDDLRQIHWKLTAKTGKLILREPMEPRRGLALVTMVLSGSPDELDSKFGRLLWISERLLENGVPHEIRCLTGRGVESFSVRGQADVTQAVYALLASPGASSPVLPEMADAVWQYHIGGVSDEKR